MFIVILKVWQAYFSALSYQHKINNIDDPTQSFVVKKCLQGYQNKKGSNDTRLPITPSIMKRLISSLQITTKSHFSLVLFKAMYLVAFHCFLRIGEFTYTKGRNEHLLTVNNVQFLKTDYLVPYAFELTISSGKHNKGQNHLMLVEANKKDTDLCPVLALWKYFQLQNRYLGHYFRSWMVPQFLEHILPNNSTSH